MLWFMGFLTTFVLGGMTGVLMSVPGADFQLHNSLFLVAHFHNMIIGGVLFGFFAGFAYWFPKFTGFHLNERLGRYEFWSWIIGFLLAFIPLYILGLMGMTRRLYQVDPSWHLLLIVAAVGAGVIALGIFFQVLQLVVSIWQRKQHRATGDPWNGRTLEWATSSPPPEYNFAEIPVVEGRDAFWLMKKNNTYPAQVGSAHVPQGTVLGFVIAVLALFFGFAMVWHIWWLAVLGIVGIIAVLVLRSFTYESAHGFK
jgi:cytochrome o ubiquinol oxidase subunit I